MHILVICIFAFDEALMSALSGGTDINSLSAMGYAFIGTIGCFTAWFYITNTKKKKVPTSELLHAEGIQWLMDSFLSLAVLVGFFIAFLLQLYGYNEYARYADPLMVIIAVVFFIRMPAKSFIEGIKGLLIMSPDRKIYTSTKQSMEELTKKHGFQDLIFRVGRSGRELIYEVNFIAKDPKDTLSIEKMDDIRKEVVNRLQALYENPIWLSVSFIYDKKLADPMK